MPQALSRIVFGIEDRQGTGTVFAIGGFHTEKKWYRLRFPAQNQYVVGLSREEMEDIDKLRDCLFYWCRMDVFPFYKKLKRSVPNQPWRPYHWEWWHHLSSNIPFLTTSTRTKLFHHLKFYIFIGSMLVNDSLDVAIDKHFENEVILET